MKPHRSILDPTFRYTSSAHTDIRKTFSRIRRELKEAQKRDELPAPQVVPMIRLKGSKV